MRAATSRGAPPPDVGSAGSSGRGEANILVSFYAVNKAGQYGAAVMYAFSSTGKRRQFAVADASGARKEDAAYLFERR